MFKILFAQIGLTLSLILSIQGAIASGFGLTRSCPPCADYIYKTTQQYQREKSIVRVEEDVEISSLEVKKSSKKSVETIFISSGTCYNCVSAEYQVGSDTLQEYFK